MNGLEGGTELEGFGGDVACNEVHGRSDAADDDLPKASQPIPPPPENYISASRTAAHFDYCAAHLHLLQRRGICSIPGGVE